MWNFSQAELDQLSKTGVTQEEFETQRRLFPNEPSFEVLLNGAIAWKEGRGQVRNEPFAPQGAPQTGSVETNGVKSIPVDEYNALSEEEKKEYQVEQKSTGDSEAQS